MGKVQVIVSRQETKNKKVHEIAEEIKRLFNKAYIYVVMDDEVALGLYENGTYQICLASGKRLWPIPWEYVREIAVFWHNQELRLRCFGEEFKGRFRVDDPKQGLKTYIVDETQKLWGTVEEELDGWSLLTSSRGTRIWVPTIFGNGEGDKDKEIKKTVGILVRRYMDFPDASKNRGLICSKDERFLDFCPWPQKGE